jgi:hypothetical protein
MRALLIVLGHMFADKKGGKGADIVADAVSAEE